MDGMVPELPIIILRRYAHAIDAQLAKAKLDAYGIPCFLSNEELAALYPLPYMQGMEVTLHIFEVDREKAETILDSAEGI
ncbi:MAG: putative signal transducing protein [Chryseotalea sp.]|jgi:hypothetical protein